MWYSEHKLPTNKSEAISTGGGAVGMEGHNVANGVLRGMALDSGVIDCVGVGAITEKVIFMPSKIEPGVSIQKRKKNS
jgi:hypothetical protein